ncbi:MAG: septum formation initiator family protein [Candidatus Dormibacteraceae bacterium]
MRHSKATAAAGTLRSNSFGLRHAVVAVIVGVGAIWAGVAFAQEAYIGHKLSQQAADLRRQNSSLAAQNQGYRKDVQAITSGAANEEEARQNGYTRPNERVYLIAPIPTPSPSPKPTPRPSPVPSPSSSPKTH